MCPKASNRLLLHSAIYPIPIGTSSLGTMTSLTSHGKLYSVDSGNAHAEHTKNEATILLTGDSRLNFIPAENN